MTPRFHRAPHQVVRYGPIVRLLKRVRPGAKVLEVGSGATGIGTWLRRTFVGVDLEFTHRLAPNMRPVRGDATRLPFKSHVFEVVLCVAVLPWLQGPVDGALEELARVGNDVVVVSTPCGSEADESDRRNIEWCAKRGLQVPQWLEDQHRGGLPSPEEIRSVLGRHGRVREGASISVPWNERVFRFERRMGRVPGMGTAVQPVLSGWGKIGARPLLGDGPPYERWFALEMTPTVSPRFTDS